MGREGGDGGTWTGAGEERPINQLVQITSDVTESSKKIWGRVFFMSGDSPPNKTGGPNS